MTKRAIVLFFFAVVAACSHKSSSTPEGAVVAGPQRVNEEAGPCSGPCCTRPQSGAPCTGDADAGETCAWANQCPTGLVTTEETKCTNGSWTVVSGACPADGEVDERGCPASQPAPDSPCSNINGTPCGYVIACEGGVSATAQAICNGTKWQTIPLKC